jgi:hypothetical protein
MRELYNYFGISKPFTYRAIKVYPAFIRLYEFNDPTFISQEGLEPQITKKKSLRSKTQKQTEFDLLRSIRRTKTTISDLVLCNDFDLFCTFTFAEEREDVQKSKQKMSRWLHSQQKKWGKFRYLIVPEFHKDGKAIHFHALLGGYKGRLRTSGIWKKGREIWNLPGYHGGFSTAVKIDDVAAVSSYVRKYITKEMPIFENKARFWSSQHLIRPEVISSESDLAIFDNEFNPLIVDKAPIFENQKLRIHQFETNMGLSNNFRRVTWPRIEKLSKAQSMFSVLVKNLVNSTVL